MNHDLAGRFASGLGPAPRTFQVARDPAPLHRALDQTRVCSGCGAVLWYGESCPDCKPRSQS